MQKMIELKCEVCKSPFQRRLTEHKRNVQRDFRVVCSKKCWVSLPKGGNPHGNPSNLMKGKPTDEFSPYRKILNNLLRRDNKSTLTLEKLKKIWEKQNGICPYTGIKMFLPATSSQRKVRMPVLASLDRIDSTKGYSEDNVEFVCLFINLGKNGFSKQSILDILSHKK